MRGKREVKQHRSWVSSGDRSGLGDPSVAVLGDPSVAMLGDPSVAVLEPSRDTGLSLQRRVELGGSPGCSCTAALAARTVGLLARGEGQDPSGCGAVIKKRVLDLSRELSAPGLALLLPPVRGCKASPGGHRAGPGFLRGFSFPKQRFGCDG